jgi:hypothetical protein
MACRECLFFIFSCDAQNAISPRRIGRGNTTVGYSALHAFQIIFLFEAVLKHRKDNPTNLQNFVLVKSIYIGIGSVASLRPPNFKILNLQKLNLIFALGSAFDAGDRGGSAVSRRHPPWGGLRRAPYCVFGVWDGSADHSTVACRCGRVDVVVLFCCFA